MLRSICLKRVLDYVKFYIVDPISHHFEAFISLRSAIAILELPNKFLKIRIYCYFLENCNTMPRLTGFLQLKLFLRQPPSCESAFIILVDTDPFNLVSSFPHKLKKSCLNNLSALLRECIQCTGVTKENIENW